MFVSVKSERNVDYYDNPSKLGYRLRQKRFAYVQSLIDTIVQEKGSCSILDIGGRANYWHHNFSAIDRQKLVSVTLCNIDESEKTPDSEQIRWTLGDATALDYPDNAFDLVHSNSTIEHVGRWADMEKMAQNVRRLASRYYIQVPYFWFPVEPHFRAVGFHWLPEQWRVRLVQKYRCGFHGPEPDLAKAMHMVQSACLLDRKQLQALFPDARIENEKFYGLTKSLMAIKG
jgi:hypothetical protein